MLRLVHDDDTPMVSALSMLGDGWWIAGGTPLRWYQRCAVDSDVDLYFNSAESFQRMQGRLQKIAEKFDTRRVSYLQVTKVHSTDNADTYRLDVNPVGDADTVQEYTVQLIKRRWYADPRQLLEDFDITVCQIATDGEQLWTSAAFARDVHQRRLRFSRVTANSAKRLIKYWIYGFEPDDATIQRICDQPELTLRSTDDY